MASTQIYAAFRRSVARTPGAPALTFEGRTWAYAELRDEAEAAAAHLERLGVHRGDRIAFFSRNSAAYAVGWLATQRLGAVHVPVNFMLGAGEVAYILEHCAPRVLAASAELMATAVAAAELAAPATRVTDLADLLGRQEPAEDGEPAEHTEAATAQIAYTSGTESKPKGAVLTDDGLIKQYLSCIHVGDYADTDVVVNAMPLYHCAQMHCFLTPYLLLGAHNILLGGANPDELIDTIARFEATSFFAPPTVWIGILRSPAFDPQRLRSLQKGYYGAAAMPAEVLHELRAQLPWLRLWNYYGQTEIGPLATALLPEEHDERPGSVGRPVLFVESRVVDDKGDDVPPGTVGELIHRSPQLLREYYRDPSKTRESYTGDWFHTGDLAVRDEEGYLAIVDRKKDMINTGGENVSSREVEEAIYAHPAVAEVAVVGAPDPKWVERVCCFVVPRAGTAPDANEIIEWAGRTLARFKLPKAVHFVDELPKNPSGKVLKRELRRSLTEHAPVTESAAEAR